MNQRVTVGLALFIAVWWACGSASFVYWWTTKWDFTTDEIGVAVVSGLIGPFNYLVEQNQFGPKTPPVVLLPCRLRKDPRHKPEPPQ